MGRSTRLVLIVVLAVPALNMVSAVAVTAATATEPSWPFGFEVIRRYPWPSTFLSTLLLAVAAWLLLRREERRAAGVDLQPPPMPELPGWVVHRPREADRVTASLRRRGGRTVGITTALHGAGGFGKTTLADVICSDQRTRRHFRGHIYQVTIGRDARTRAAIAAKVNETVYFITGQETTFEDPRMAGQHLGRLLNERPRLLLVIDDVWEATQLEPFLIGGRNCVRLVTTRVPSVLPDGAVSVLVDQMAPEQAQRLLTWELPVLPPEIVGSLLALTGRWPLLLRLINRILSEAAPNEAAVQAEADAVLRSLRTGGPAAMDDLADPVLDLDDPRERARAVRATMKAGTQLLPAGGEDRFVELGIFAEDEAIPIDLVLSLWEATGSLDRSQGRRLCQLLARLSLVSLSENSSMLSLHDVVRDYLRAESGPERITADNRAFVDALAATLPVARPLASGVPHPEREWWELDNHCPYVWEHLVHHLLAAGRQDQADAVAGDLRWLEVRLQRFGPSAVYTDLSQVPTQRAITMSSSFARAAHLLTPTDPEHAVIDILHARVGHASGWQPQVFARRTALIRTRLLNRWPLPDLPTGAVRRTLTGHGRPMCTVAICPDGTWLATAGYDHTVRLWDATTGKIRRELTGHREAVRTVAISPDGTWLITASDLEDTVWLWDAATGRPRKKLTRQATGVRAVAISPDGTWFTTGGHDKRVRVREARTGRIRRKLVGHYDTVRTIAISPDGSWLATGSDDKTVRLWDAVTGRERCELTGHSEAVHAVAISPDSTRLATASDDGTVQLWDPATGTRRAVLTGHTHGVYGVAFSPDGAVLASAGHDKRVLLWEPTTGRLLRELEGHSAPVRALAFSPDSTWLATASDDGSARMWDAGAPPNESPPLNRLRVNAVACSPDGAVLASAGDDKRVLLWESTTGRIFRELNRHRAAVRALAFSPDSTWLATASDDGSARMWDAATGDFLGSLTGHTRGVRAMAISPDGTWLVTVSYDHMVRLWNTATRQLRSQLVLDAVVHTVAVSPDGAWLATASHHEVLLWDTATATMRTELANRTYGKALWLWDAAIWWIRSTLTDRSRPAPTLAIAPDGAWLAAVDRSGRTVHLWDAATGARQVALTGHTRRVHTVAISPDGAWLATASGDHTVRLWDVATGQIRGEVTGPTHGVCALAISPDGVWLATATDGTLRVWDTGAGRCAALMRTAGDVTQLIWLPDSRGIALVGGSGLYVFDFHPGSY